ARRQRYSFDFPPSKIFDPERGVRPAPGPLEVWFHHITLSNRYPMTSSARGRMRDQTPEGPGDHPGSTQAKVGGSAVNCGPRAPPPNPPRFARAPGLRPPPPPARTGQPDPATSPGPPPTPPRRLPHPGQRAPERSRGRGGGETGGGQI